MAHHNTTTDLEARLSTASDKGREQLDLALREALFTAALDCIIVIDSDSRIIEFNQSAEQTFGYDRSEVIGRDLADVIIPPALRDAHHAGMAKFLKTGENAVLGKRIEVPAVRKNGEEILVELAVSAVEVEDAKYFAAYLRDITAEKHRQEALAASEQRYQDLFERSGDAIFVHTLDGELRDMNLQAEKLVGQRRADLIGKSVANLHPESSHPAARDAIKTLQSQGWVRADLDFLGAGGTVIPTEVNARSYESQGETLVHGVVRDVSQRTRTERELRDARDEAERASAAKTDFLANMSHEMRTPLNGVIGPLSLIDHGSLPDKSVELLEMAQRSADALLLLIDDVLDISQIEAGQVDFVSEPYSVASLLEQVQETFSMRAAEKGLSLDVRPTRVEQKVIGDAGRVQQVLINLVGNAIKYTDQGRVSVDAAVNESNGKAMLSFRVLDTGPGIPEADQANLFNRFERAQSFRSEAGGVGLGLAICKNIVSLMNGRIGLESRPDEGSMFWFEIPVEFSTSENRQNSGPSSETLEFSGRVLLAEDSPTNAAVATTMLSRLGLTPDTVTDGAAAVQAALQIEYDLILMDVGMPVMDGLEATRLLRQQGVTTPIVALTAHALKEIKDSTEQAGMDGYMTKPVRPTHLSRILARWLPERDTAQTQVIDEQARLEQWGDDEDGYRFVADIFRQELSDRLEKIRLARQEHDTKTLIHHAHAIKGGASNVAANALSQSAESLEAELRNNVDLTSLTTRFEALNREAKVFLDALETGKS